jgi:DNA primase
MKDLIELTELKSPYYFQQTAAFAETIGIKLKQSGKFYIGSCPFHSDTKPSFYLHHSKGAVRFTCFSEKCKGSWDIFALIQDIENCDFIHAVKRFSQYLSIEKVILPRGNKISVNE